MDNIDAAIARLCNRLMGAEQQALDALTYALDEMEFLVQQNPDREDIRACIEEIKEKVKADESNHWVICNRWCEHFDGITTESDEVKGADSEDDEKESELDGDEDDE